VLIGGAPAGAEFSADHLTTLWGKRIVGVLGGGGRSRELMGTIMALYAQHRFPVDRLVGFFDLADVEKALEASYAGQVIKPILTMPS
jgi:aryl-alcohol dehydrogenase